MRKFLVLFLLGCFLFAGQGSVHAQAQSTARASLYSLQTDSFPTITTGLDVMDATGNSVSGLTTNALTLLEDDQPRPIRSLDEIQAGVEFALALDPGPAFAYRDANAVTRYDKIFQVLKDWAANHPDALGDDLSLVPTYGVQSTHLAKTSEFSANLAAYQPNLLFITPSVNTLARALDAVSEPTSQVGMKRTVLFVTSPTSLEAIPTLQSLTERATAQQVRVNVWIVASADFFSSSGATALKDLAIQTGGEYVMFTGVEPLPGLELYLHPLRSTYRLTYDSNVLTSGGHSLTVRVNLDGQTVTSDPLSFNLDIQPPNPILVAPPAQIVRHAPDERTTDIATFLPNQQSIDIIVEFPDGRTRPLVRTTLYADGQKVAENTVAPFDKFTWDLSGYSSSGQHILTVEAQDTFGLSKTSLGVPVMLTIVRPKFGLLPFLARNSRWVALAAILSAGVVLGVILAGGQRRRRSRRVKHASHNDPLTQPVDGLSGRHSMRLPWKHPAKPADAYLVRLKDDGQPVTAPPIPISAPDMTFGSDPMQATRILDDPSVSPVHARLREENGGFILSDERSVAGTWVNFEQITAPRRLQHGDLLQIGRLSYRFMLRKPPEQATPKITFLKL
jgi:hypothetical protein